MASSLGESRSSFAQAVNGQAAAFSAVCEALDSLSADNKRLQDDMAAMQEQRARDAASAESLEELRGALKDVSARLEASEREKRRTQDQLDKLATQFANVTHNVLAVDDGQRVIPDVGLPGPRTAEQPQAAAAAAAAAAATATTATTTTPAANAEAKALEAAAAAVEAAAAATEAAAAPASAAAESGRKKLRNSILMLRAACNFQIDPKEQRVEDVQDTVIARVRALEEVTTSIGEGLKRYAGQSREEAAAGKGRLDEVERLVPDLIGRLAKQEAELEEVRQLQSGGAGKLEEETNKQRLADLETITARLDGAFQRLHDPDAIAGQIDGLRLAMEEGQREHLKASALHVDKMLSDLRRELDAELGKVREALGPMMMMGGGGGDAGKATPLQEALARLTCLMGRSDDDDNDNREGSGEGEASAGTAQGSPPTSMFGAVELLARHAVALDTNVGEVNRTAQTASAAAASALAGPGTAVAPPTGPTVTSEELDWLRSELALKVSRSELDRNHRTFLAGVDEALVPVQSHVRALEAELARTQQATEAYSTVGFVEKVTGRLQRDLERLKTAVEDVNAVTLHGGLHEVREALKGLAAQVRHFADEDALGRQKALLSATKEQVGELDQLVRRKADRDELVNKFRHLSHREKADRKQLLLVLQDLVAADSGDPADPSSNGNNGGGGGGGGFSGGVVGSAAATGPVPAQQCLACSRAVLTPGGRQYAEYAVKAGERAFVYDPYDSDDGELRIDGRRGGGFSTASPVKGGRGQQRVRPMSAGARTMQRIRAQGSMPMGPARILQQQQQQQRQSPGLSPVLRNGSGSSGSRKAGAGRQRPQSAPRRRNNNNNNNKAASSLGVAAAAAKSPPPTAIRTRRSSRQALRSPDSFREWSAPGSPTNPDLFTSASEPQLGGLAAAVALNPDTIGNTCSTTKATAGGGRAGAGGAGGARGEGDPPQVTDATPQVQAVAAAGGR